MLWFNRHGLAMLCAVVPASALLGDWTLVKLTDAARWKGAVCLDGSPAAYYIRPPLVPPPPPAPNQWLVFNEGGGWCNGDANCFSRSTTDLGSSARYPAGTPVGAEAADMFDALPAFTVVYAKYCDGSSMTSDRDDVVLYQGNASQPVWYRGRRVRDALLDDLLATRGLADASALLWAGCSAGALTAYSHVDWVAARVPATITTVGMGDAMFSLQWKDYADRTSAVSHSYYTTQFTWGFDAWNASGAVNQACRAHFSNASDAWVCFHGATAMRFVKTPTLVVNSKYDTWQERGVLGLNTTECPGSVDASGNVTLCKDGSAESVDQHAYWLEYGEAMLKAVGQIDKRHGAFLTNCPGHCATSGKPFAESAFPGTVLKAAIMQWFPEAVANGTQLGWSAPRWMAKSGEPCHYAHAAD